MPNFQPETHTSRRSIAWHALDIIINKITPRIPQNQYTQEVPHTSMTTALLVSLERTEKMICPMLTRATVPWGLPKAPRIPVCSLQTHQAKGMNKSSLFTCVQAYACAIKKKKYKPIGASTGQHLIDTDDVEGMHANTHVEGILARDLGDVFVAANAAGFEGLGRNLLVLVRD
ncbi:hypothetical protein BC936DRAFT_142281 [Jimgerdemannia flammicorona]|uniref:Uncharacterized protein n=1 Tax=Jimgerdemannia flammicorona TaxID=994334 RepID=A0A433DMG5_9FUNG|nr:hypothetical protein BC936DRAFT_142281 [Jimgerdemannia flammicorona]